MKTIEIFENIRKNNNFDGTGVSKELYWAYEKSLERETEILDFDDTYRADVIAEIVNSMKDLGITEFTVSSGWSSTIEALWAFQQNGCNMNGMVRVNTVHKDWETGVRETKPAVLFSL